MSTVLEKTDKSINIGLTDEHREKIAAALNRLLADSYMLYLKTHNYHWNVTGMNFQPLHELFEEQYTELAEAIDAIAEQIRTLGHFAPGSFKAYSKITSIEEEEDVPSAEVMVKRLQESNETLIRTAREALGPCEEAGDEASLDLVTERLRNHSKVAWMLRSHLQ
ncbi:Dps family protein [Natronogracilivirga saccharolytica]|uniref:DNA starvation/stationary phase protection protein n=1 Tax=Natronogracilivirga saccharolytica TaxID=2812953 RepID=A0A8J7RKA5_9BACT|nr:Dps family protein [Natronogracilivirga saccharolytica]MBP3192802.1 DNA starvation/stationary phase protection protein [Natronogracilivirga saccharolytica]